MRTSRKWSALKRLIWFHAQNGGSSYIRKIISGVLPLSVSDAVNKAIPKLIRFGKCYQSGTPTSASPVPIQCNNGTLTKIDNELPVGYKRITSIKFDGKFYYNTGEPLTGDDEVTMTLDDTVSGGQNVFGSYNGTGGSAKNFSLYLYGAGSSNSCYFRYGSQLLRPRFGDGERTITFGKSGTTGFLTDVTVEQDIFETEAPAYIGMLPNSSSPEYTGRIVGNITVGTRLKWIPCERELDGAIGYYEAVNGNFVAPTGTGTPTRGDYDESHMTILRVVGTPEVLSIGSQTATVENLLAVGSIKDEQDIIKGTVTRRVTACIYDGSQPVGSSFVSSTGGKDIGAVIVYPLAQPVTETVARQPLSMADGSNTVSTLASISGVEAEVQYFAVEAPSDVVIDWKNVELDDDGAYFGDLPSWTPTVGESYLCQMSCSASYVMPTGEVTLIASRNRQGTLILKAEVDPDWWIEWGSSVYPDNAVLSGTNFFGGEVVSLTLHKTPL